MGTYWTDRRTHKFNTNISMVSHYHHHHHQKRSYRPLYIVSTIINEKRSIEKKNVTHISPFKSNSNRIDSNEMNGTGWDGIGLEATRAARFIYNEIESA